MCPAHRLSVLDEVRKRLSAGERCYLVSTQLIEAGVDVDFPIVLREMAPLDAIIQAAGRCNREGKLNGPDQRPGGRVVVFRSRAAKEDGKRYFPQDPWYVLGRDVLEQFFLGTGRLPSVDDPDVINEYFDCVFNGGELDQHQIRRLREAQNFPKVGEKYRLIEDAGTPVVTASWEERRDEISRLIEAARERPTRARLRALAPFQVNLRFPTRQQGSFIVEEPNGLSLWYGGYEPEMGLWEELLDEQTIV
jgi:CRISPR-associated endonuclease/helicase Cas3